MGDRRRQFYMAHAFSANFGQRHFDTTFFTNDAAVLHPLVFAAEAFVIFDRPKNPSAEQTVPFGFKGPVVDRFRLLDFTKRPGSDPIWTGDGNLNLVETLGTRRLPEKIHQLVHRWTPEVILGRAIFRHTYITLGSAGPGL